MKKEILLRAGKLETIVPDDGHSHRYSLIVPVPAKEFLYFDTEVSWQKEFIFEETSIIENGRMVYHLIEIKDPVPTLTNKPKKKHILRIKSI